jgi:ribosomal protein L40E
MPEPEAPLDVVAQPTWQIMAPDGAPTTPGSPAVAPTATPSDPIAASAEPQWPTEPEWPAQRPAAGGLPFLGRPAAATGGIEALWAESAREVAATAEGAAAKAVGGVQPCVSCGLSLSATARFCRRCGTRQG